MQVHASWRTILQTILNTAAWKLEFTSMLRLNPVVPEESIIARLKSLDRITRLRTTLRIPNPDLGPTFKQLFDEMQRGGIRELTQDMRNERGLNLAPDTLPQAVLDMAATGYRKGKIHVYGVKDGNREELTIADDIARVEGEELGDYIEGYVEGYSAASRSSAVKRFATSIVKKIDERLER
jgi:hypothetical protein